jgi:hypothetical protein
MARRIAVEDGLTNVEQALRKEGYEVTKLTSGSLTNVDAAIITGMSNDFMGFADTRTKVPVVEAHGMTAEGIVSSLQARFQELGK